MAPRARSILPALAVIILLAPGAPAQEGRAAHLPEAGPDARGEEASAEVSAADWPAGLEAAHGVYLRDRELQLERPHQAERPPPPPSEPADWTRAIARLLDGLAPVFRAVFYLAILVTALALGWFLFGEALRLRPAFRRRRQSPVREETSHPARPDAAKARGLLDEADALAARGHFGEAVHLLLFSSIEDMERRLEGGVAPSLTAREIAGLARLPEAAGKALRPIIRIVENSHFGGRMVDADAWQVARRSYQDFAFGPGWI